MAKLSIKSPLFLALLVTVAIFVESNLVSGHGYGAGGGSNGSGGFGRGGSGGSFGDNGGHAGNGGSGASNTIPRRDGYGVTTIHHNPGVSNRYFFIGARAKELANQRR